VSDRLNVLYKIIEIADRKKSELAEEMLVKVSNVNDAFKFVDEYKLEKRALEIARDIVQEIINKESEEKNGR